MKCNKDRASLEMAIIAMSSGLMEVKQGTPEYKRLKNAIEVLFEEWRDLEACTNPCDCRIND